MQESSEHGRKALQRAPRGSSCIPRRGGGHGVVLFFALLALLSGGGTQAASSGPKHRARQGQSAVSSSVVAWRDGLQQWGRAGAAGGLRTRGCFASLPIPPASSPVRDVRGRDVRCGVMWSTVLTKWPGLLRPSLSARFSPPDTGSKEAGVGLLGTRGGASAVAPQSAAPTPHTPTAIIDIDTHQLSSSLSHTDEHLHDSPPHASVPKPLVKEVVSLGLNPSVNGSLWDMLAFKWVDPLMKRGNGKALEMSDLWELRDEDSMAALSTRFQDVYGVEAERALARNVSAWDGRRSTWLHSPLIRSLWVIFKKPLVVTGVIRLLASFAQFCPALLVNRLLRVLEAGSGMDVTMGYRYSLLLALSLVAKTTLDNQFYHHTAVMSLQIRSLISTCVYRKSLRLSPAARQRSTVGEIVNMMQLDANRLDQVASSVHSVWSGALDIVGYLALLVHFMGPSMLAGIAIMVMVIPLNAGFLSLLAKCRERTLKFSDARVKLTNEVLQGMRSIKSYAWEGAFLNQLSSTRASELGTIQEAATLRAILVAFLGATPAIVAMVTIWAFVSLGKNVLSASRIFTAIALFNQLRFPLLFYPMVIAAVAEGRVALRRLQGFLDGEEVENNGPATTPASHTPPEPHTDGPVFAHVTEASQAGIRMQGAQFSYGTGNASATTAESSSGRLLNCTLSVRPGELVAVVGSLGSGKSSLVRAILGEMRLEGGEVAVKGKLAYVAQSAWVPNDSLRNAVLFGQSLDRTKYAHTLQACGLLPDLALLESGDATEVGERGVTLSGGQKQRLALARAVYHDADVYLLDDPLSALDAHVAKEVFEGCILRGPLSSKARLLVTNQLQFLPYVDKVIVMGAEEGGACRLLDQGTYQELRSRGFDLEALVKQQQQASLTEGATEEAQAPPAVTPEAEPFSEVSPSEPEMPMAVKEEGAKEEGGGGAKVEVVAKAAKKLMKDEERLTGAVKKEVYLGYLKAVRSPLLLGLTVLAYVVANATQFLQQAVISAWTADPLHLKHGASWYLGGVSAMALLVALGNYLRTYLTVLAGVRASKQLHLDSLRRVLRAPMRYFDSTPVGQLLQRFSTDMDQVDQQLPGSLGMFIMCVLQIAGSLGAILAATPLFAVCVLPLSLIYLSVMNYFRNVTRELKRLDSLARSPIFSHLSETLGGLSIIRAFKRERHFIASNEKKVDASVRAHFALKAGDRWLSVRLELLGNVVVLVGGLLAVQAASRGKLGAGLAGLAITNALGVTGLLNWAVRCLAETEAQMNSVERIQTLIHRIPHEAPEIVEPLSTETTPVHHDQAPVPSSATSASNPIAAVPLRALQGDSALVGSGWPWQGGLYLRNVVLRYREESDAVLHGLSVAIRPREKIGIVGRTGAGKSSLFVALLRLVEAESGSMEIDGVDISTVGLSTLRSAITVIPQDPVLFSGTIRSNLDPFGRYEDIALWEALRKASLDKLVRGLPGQLDSSVAEYGENLSCGQRQLLCLARALLRKSRILLLDEATSSVDYETDAIIQRTIRREFGDVTVLTIAHRLKTILDSSRIMVMKNGRLAEMDTPKALLARPNSLFSQLVRSSEASSDILRDAPLPTGTQPQTLQPTAA